MTAFWATPTITIAHLVFAIGTTVYMLVAIVFEERDLVRHFGRNYEQYRENVPKLIPRILATRPRATSDEAGAVATGQGRR
jgi:protein-S-isoprenylcysteine O-methyltransferase Ste14